MDPQRRSMFTSAIVQSQQDQMAFRGGRVPYGRSNRYDLPLRFPFARVSCPIHTHDEAEGGCVVVDEGRHMPRLSAWIARIVLNR